MPLPHTHTVLQDGVMSRPRHTTNTHTPTPSPTPQVPRPVRVRRPVLPPALRPLPAQTNHDADSPGLRRAPAALPGGLQQARGPGVPADAVASRGDADRYLARGRRHPLPPHPLFQSMHGSFSPGPSAPLPNVGLELWGATPRLPPHHPSPPRHTRPLSPRPSTFAATPSLHAAARGGAPGAFVALHTPVGPAHSVAAHCTTPGALPLFVGLLPLHWCLPGGRSSQHQWNEAASCVTFEFWAQWYAEQGNETYASAFKRAAALSLQVGPGCMACCAPCCGWV